MVDGNKRFATELFAGMRGMGRVWQAAGTVDSILRPDLLERAVDAGLRSIFVGFETINADNLTYAGGWKKFERVRDVLIRSGQVLHALPMLETALSSFGTRAPGGHRHRRGATIGGGSELVKGAAG